MFKWIRSSLANTLTFYISVFLIIVLAIAGVFGATYLRGQAETQILNQTRLKTQVVSAEIKDVFENAVFVVEMLQDNESIGAYLDSVDHHGQIETNPHYDRVMEVLQKTQLKSSFFRYTWIANEQASFYLDHEGTFPGVDYDIIRRPWYPGAVDADPIYFSVPYVEWTSGTVVVSIMGKVKKGPDRVGFVSVDIQFKDLPSLFANTHFSDHDRSYLISDTGGYIYHPQADQIGRGGIHQEDDLLYPFRDLILEGGQAEAMAQVEVDGRSYYLSVYDVGDFDWKVVTLLDAGSVFADMNRAAIWFSLLSVIVVIGTLLLVFYIVRNSTKPYKHLVSYGKNIEDGDLSRNLPGEYLQRTDEMGALSRTFQMVIDAFRNETTLLEQELAEINRELEAQYAHILETEKVASLGNIVAGVAHEINTPIGNCLSTATYLETISSDLEDKFRSGQMTKRDLQQYIEASDESCAIMISSLQRSAQLINNFRQVAVDQSSNQRYRFNVSETIDNIVTSLRHEYKRHHVTIDNQCPVHIEIDSYPGEYAQILTNLIINSLRHGFQGRDQGRISINAESSENRFFLFYEDDGKGMSHETLHRLYEPFYTTNRGSGNSGLGMHIVYNIVTQKLGGTVMCESAPGQGVKFIISVPVEEHMEA